jgi:hypothetical protein
LPSSLAETDFNVHERIRELIQARKQWICDPRNARSNLTVVGSEEEEKGSPLRTKEIIGEKACPRVDLDRPVRSE